MIWQNKTEWQHIHTLETSANGMWVPPILHSNAISDVHYMESHRKITRIYIYPNGELNWETITKISSTCHLKLKNFPFDSQTCDISFESSLSNDLIQLRYNEMEIEANFTSPSDVWEVMRDQPKPAKVDKIFYTGLSGLVFDRVTFAIAMKRKPTLYVVTLIMPNLGMVVLLLFSKFIDPSDSNRPMFCLTVMLSLAVLSSVISNTVPASAEIINMTIYTSVCIGVGLICTIYTLLACAFSKWKCFNKKIGKISLLQIIDTLFFLLLTLASVTVTAVIFQEVNAID